MSFSMDRHRAYLSNLNFFFITISLLDRSRKYYSIWSSSINPDPSCAQHSLTLTLLYKECFHHHHLLLVSPYMEFSQNSNVTSCTWLVTQLFQWMPDIYILLLVSRFGSGRKSLRQEQTCIRIHRDKYYDTPDNVTMHLILDIHQLAGYISVY